MAPDLAEKVRQNEISLDRAERIIRDREAEARRIEQARKEAAAQPEPTVVDIRHGDFREVLADLADIDAIITDPPYPHEYIPLLADLAAWADKVLKPDGMTVTVTRQRLTAREKAAESSGAGPCQSRPHCRSLPETIQRVTLVTRAVFAGDGRFSRAPGVTA